MKIENSLKIEKLAPHHQWWGVKKLKITFGFTLVEMLVVISTITILTLIIVPIYQGSRNQLSLQRAASKLAQDIRQTQGMAMSAKECPIEKCGGPPAIIPPRYGIEFGKDRDYYFLFADLNQPGGNGKYESAPDEKIETIYLEKGITIKELRTPASKETVWVTFNPPDPLTTIRDPGERLILRIQLANVNNQTKIVRINNAGLIYIE